jgi:hypothetical protein
MRINELHEELIALHGEPSAVQSDDGVRQLVTTILSQNVADIHSDYCDHFRDHVTELGVTRGFPRVLFRHGGKDSQ